MRFRNKLWPSAQIRQMSSTANENRLRGVECGAAHGSFLCQRQTLQNSQHPNHEGCIVNVWDWRRISWSEVPAAKAFPLLNTLVHSCAARFLCALVASYNYTLLHDSYFLGSSSVGQNNLRIFPHIAPALQPLLYTALAPPLPIPSLLYTSWACWVLCVATSANHKL